MIAIVFIFGLIIGSFLNALIYRLHSGESVAAGRSHCVHCGHELAALDLVPLLSFVWLRGRCRYCGKPISWRYPIVELLTALCFVLVVHNFHSNFSDVGLWFQMISVCFLIIIIFFDLEHYLILDTVVIPASILAAIFLIYRSFALHNFGLHSPIIQGLLGIAIVAGFFGLQYFISRGTWIGFGDVKFGVFLGLLFGVGMSLMLLLLAYCTGAVFGLVLISMGKRKMSGRLPFGTFLGISGIILLLYGSSILNWYLGLLGL